MVEPPVLGIALAAGMEQGKCARGAGLQEPRLEADQELFRDAVAAVAGRCQNVAVADERHGVGVRNHLLERHSDASPAMAEERGRELSYGIIGRSGIGPRDTARNRR